MRLYTRTGAAQVSVRGTVYTADEGGAFEFPQDVGAELHSFHMDGKPAWEDDAERAARLVAEQLEKVRDPATTLAELQKMTALLANALGGAPAASASEAAAPEAPAEPAPAPVAKTSRSRKAAATPPADAPSA